LESPKLVRLDEVETDQIEAEAELRRIGSEERSVHGGAEQIGLEAEEWCGCFWRFRADRAQRSQFGSDLRRDLFTKVPSRSGLRPRRSLAVFGDSEQTELEGASSDRS
jgi:hypothetical protein